MSLMKIFLVLSLATLGSLYTPIVLWHGLTGSNYGIMKTLPDYLKKSLPDVYIVLIEFGKNHVESTLQGITMHPDRQIELACKIITGDPMLADGFNAIGQSQGSQFLRGLVQRCPKAKIKNLISMAGQHQGWYGIPTCNPDTIQWCDDLRKSWSQLVYLEFFQRNLAPPTYWHDPLQEDAYRRGSTFLADINNERDIDESYIKNLQRLEKFVMIKQLNDTIVIPLESSWFGFYKPGQDKEIQSLFESEIYIQDRLGLKQMAEDGKLYFLENDWKHLDFNEEWFQRNIVEQFLK